VAAVRVNERTVLAAPDALAELMPAAFGLYARVSSHDQKPDGLPRVSRTADLTSIYGSPDTSVGG